MNSKKTSLQTTAVYEKQGDRITFDIKLTNYETEPKELTFGSGQQYEITIIDEAGNEVYRYSDDRFFTMALIQRRLSPGESLSWREAWNCTDKEGNRLGKGAYQARIEVMAGSADAIQAATLNSVVDFSIE